METETLLVKIADQAEEFTQIARLNYATFVEEIPQHQSNPNRALVDKFHSENTYFVAKVGASIVGMLALRNQRPFSLDSKLPNLDDFVLPGESLCEIRLLAIEPSHRHSKVLRELFYSLFAYCTTQGFDRALISGRLENIPLYTRLGFRPFAEAVGSDGARYQPMYMTRDTVNRQLRSLPVREATERPSPGNPECFLPGPVTLHASVSQKLGERPYSHRSQRYETLLAKTRQALRNLCKAPEVQILVGTGSLANDVVAAHIGQLAKPGLILSNGEFGERLVQHARGFNLDYELWAHPWGSVLDLTALEQRLKNGPDVGWVWLVQCETSTGMVNPVDAIQDLCDAHGALVHIDGVSALGLVPCDWSRAHMASSVSGKALGGATGLALVFYQPQAVANHAQKALPTYLDLKRYGESQGQPFSGSSPWLEALAAALQLPVEARAKRRLAQSNWLRQRLSQSGLFPIADEASSAPGIFTLELPQHVSSHRVGDALLAAGFECSYSSAYLLKRNWLQICLMGEFSAERLAALCEAMGRLLN